MPLNYIRRRVHLVWLFLIALFFLIGSWSLAAVIFAFYAILVALARKRPAALQDEQTEGQALILSPVSGVVKSVRSHVDHDIFGPDLIEVELSLPFWKEWGLFFPARGEVIDSVDQKEALCITLLRPDGRRIGMALAKSRLGRSASLSLLPGDRGRSAAPFGHFTFGGRLLLYLTENCEILVQVNEQVIAGQTALAAEV